MSCLSSIFVCGKHHDAANGEHVEPNGRPNNGHASGKAQLQPAPTVSSAGSGFNDMTPTDTVHDNVGCAPGHHRRDTICRNTHPCGAPGYIVAITLGSLASLHWRAIACQRS